MPDQPKRREWPEGCHMAVEIIMRHPDVFKGVPPMSDIFFVYDEENAPKSKGQSVMARVSKIAGKFVDFIDAGDKLFMLEWFSLNVGNMTHSKRLLLMAHELLHFEFDDDKGEHKLRGHDVEEFYIIADRFGLHWLDDRHGDVVDILDPDFAWGRQGQSRLNLTATAAALVNEFGLEGANAVVEAVKEAREIVDKDRRREEAAPRDSANPSGWQPEQPYATKDNVIPFHRPTGTDAPE